MDVTPAARGPRSARDPGTSRPTRSRTAPTSSSGSWRQPWSNGRVAGPGVSYSGLGGRAPSREPTPGREGRGARSSADFDQYAGLLAPGGVPHTRYFDAWRGHALARSGVLPSPDSGEMGLRRRCALPADDDPDGGSARARSAEHPDNYDFGGPRAHVPRRLALLGVRCEDTGGAPGAAQRRRLAGAPLRPAFRARGIDLASPHAYAADFSPGPPGVRVQRLARRRLCGALPRPLPRAGRHRERTAPRPLGSRARLVSPGGRGGPSAFDHAGELLRFLDRTSTGSIPGSTASPASTTTRWAPSPGVRPPLAAAGDDARALSRPAAALAAEPTRPGSEASGRASDRLRRRRRPAHPRRVVLPRQPAPARLGGRGANARVDRLRDPRRSPSRSR